MSPKKEKEGGMENRFHRPAGLENGFHLPKPKRIMNKLKIKRPQKRLQKNNNPK